ncbi:MAG: HD domain-containing protein [Candidatus Krumholzibacteriia bacterium]
MPPNFNDIEKKYAALFERLLSRRERILELKSFLENTTDWLAAPVFKRAPMDVEHGLLMHSVGVTERALRIKDLVAPDITEESVIVVALFHDVGKLDYPGKPSGLPGGDEPPRRGRHHAVRSLELVSRFIPLTEEEAQAIAAHDGLVPVEGGVVNLEYYRKECRLTMILHFADFWTAAVEEEGRR